TVIALHPASFARNVSIDAQISATFSAAMDPTTLDGATFTLRQGMNSIAGTVSYDAATRVASFAPAATLAVKTTYAATIAAGVKDARGNALAADLTWTFATAMLATVELPTVVSFTPSDGALNASVDARVTARFSEAMDPASIGAATFTLRHGATAVAGEVSYD